MGQEAARRLTGADAWPPPRKRDDPADLAEFAAVLDGPRVCSDDARAVSPLVRASHMLISRLLPYRPGARAWGKCKVRVTIEAIVGAVTGTPAAPRTLLLGRYDDTGRLRYTGRAVPLAHRDGRARGCAGAGRRAGRRPRYQRRPGRGCQRRSGIRVPVERHRLLPGSVWSARAWPAPCFGMPVPTVAGRLALGDQADGESRIASFAACAHACY